MGCQAIADLSTPILALKLENLEDTGAQLVVSPLRLCIFYKYLSTNMFDMVEAESICLSLAQCYNDIGFMRHSFGTVPSPHLLT